MKLIWIVDLAEELGVYKGTVRRWVEDDIHMETHIEDHKLCLTEEDAQKIRDHSTSNYKPGNNKTGQGFGGKKDVNYHWRKGIPTRISYGGCR